MGHEPQLDQHLGAFSRILDSELERCAEQRGTLVERERVRRSGSREHVVGDRSLCVAERRGRCEVVGQVREHAH